MIVQVGIETNFEGRTLAWALEHPGCFAYGINAVGATTNLEGALSNYAGWILRHDTHTWLIFGEGDLETAINGVWEDYFINDNYDRVAEGQGYTVESFFPYDWKPLTALEIEHGLKLLDWTRTDLLKTVEGLTQEKMNATYPAERWSINGILGHVGGAEHWYMECLGLAFPRSELPQEPIARLRMVRRHLTTTLRTLDGVKKVVAVDGEFWSPRKLLRKALWHERDHTDHIRKLL